MGVLTYFGLKVLPLKKSMKFVIFIVYLMLKSHKIVQLHQISSILFRSSFLTPKSANTPISYTTTFYHFLPTSTNFTTSHQIVCYSYQLLSSYHLTSNFCQLSPAFTTFYAISTNFYYFPLAFAKSYHFLPTFTLLLLTFATYYLWPIFTNT